MMKRVSLNTGWSLKEAPLNYGKEMAGFISIQKDGWYNELKLPCDVHMPLIDAGVIKDPVLADYCFDSEWIENRSWWFRKIIKSSELDLDCDIAELVLESLDVNADIFFNGAYLGHHASAHYPFRKDVKEFIIEGDNELLIRLTSGLETVSDADLAEIDHAVCTELANGCPERGDKRRAFVRKPTYVYGWDWTPRIGTCAIAKNAYIDCLKAAAIRNVSVRTIEASSNAKLSLTAEIELLDIIRTADADVNVKVSKDGKTYADVTKEDVLLRSGTNYVEFDLTIADAELWWPNGMGDQPLYTFEVSVKCRGNVHSWPAFKYGIRTITLDTTRTDAENRRFVIVINGKEMFCKGGDWIPADAIYARVTPEKYDALILEARNANFNMLRIWGGGIYERDEFFDACDKYGILLWHDMMFGCSTYPDHIESFRDLVGKELDYQTKRLGSRTCIALFCGNNENHWIFTSDGFPQVNIKHEKQYGLYISNVMMPEYVRKNCPWVPYWNSSPYGGEEPNADNIGDVHHWRACMMNPEMELRIEPKEYDKVNARFVTEYGYPGPCPIESIKEYFDGKEIDRNSKVWSLHNNTFEKFTVNAGIKKHYTDRELNLDEYLLYAGMTQSLMLGYSLESIRFKQFCAGGLFWMYNDCWGEVGWTIVDYYLRRKISFYGVKRAFEPVKLILRENNDGQMVIMGCNDTDKDISFKLRTGWVAFDGSNDDSETLDVTIPAYSRSVLHVLDASRHDKLTGVYYAKPECGCINPAILRAVDTRNLKLCPPKVSIVSSRDEGSDLLVEIKADTYCHGVYLDTGVEWKLSDNYFDLLPGETRTVRVYGAAGKSFDLKTVLVG